MLPTTITGSRVFALFGLLLLATFVAGMRG